MDPASIVGVSGACLSLAYRLGVLANNLHTISKAYHEGERAAILIDAQLTALSAAVASLQVWLQSADAERSQMLNELQKSVDSCDALIQFILEQTSKHQAEGQRTSFWRKTKYLWNEPTVLRFEGMLRGQVQALSLLLQVKDLTPAEQRTSLESRHTSTILRCARDDTSSLLWLRDADSTMTIASAVTDNLDRLDTKFEFDELILASKAYRSTLASFLKRRILLEGKIKNRLTSAVRSDEILDEPLQSSTDTEIESLGRPVTCRRSVSVDDPEGYIGHYDSLVPHHVIDTLDEILESLARDDLDKTSDELSDPDQTAVSDRPLKNDTLTTSHQRPLRTVGVRSDGDFAGDTDDLIATMSDTLNENTAYALCRFTYWMIPNSIIQAGEQLTILDDSSDVWWLVQLRNKRLAVWIPSRLIESELARLARYNKHRDKNLAATTLADVRPHIINSLITVLSRKKGQRKVAFATTEPVCMGTAYDYSTFNVVDDDDVRTRKSKDRIH